MKLLSLQLRHAAILSLIIISSSTLSAEPYIAQTHSQKAYIEHWQDFESAVTENFHTMKHNFSEICYFSPKKAPRFNYDVTLVGFVNYADGIGRHPILFKECLEKKVSMNFVSTRNISQEEEDSQLGLPRLKAGDDKNIGAVAILTDIIADKALNIYKRMPESVIRVAYTMFESTSIPYNWAKILNSKFDMAVVPDPFLVDVYKKNGVTIPIFVLPLPLQLHDFLKMRRRPEPHRPFTFGLTGGFWARKNHIRVLEAFAAEFGNRRDVKLRIHGRFGEEDIIKQLKDTIAKNKLTNVELIIKPFNRIEYLDFFKSLDCYVFLSMGEGFSITPREALACAKPCIVTDNTAQSLICYSGTVRAVPSNIPVPALYDCHIDDGAITNYGAEYLKHLECAETYDALHNLPQDDDTSLLWKTVGSIGFQFDCTINDARAAMRDVFDNYDTFKLKAKDGREWVKRYLRENLSKKYHSLVKPASIVMGKENIIGDTFLMTNSPDLYEKYKYLLGH
jgi:glycosyltransferase involved in cell wall biosynthesis